jgi:hypothetical protein
MKLLIAKREESTLTFGYKNLGNWKCISLTVAEIFWNTETKAFGISFGIPYIMSVGIVFNHK